MFRVFIFTICWGYASTVFPQTEADWVPLANFNSAKDGFKVIVISGLNVDSVIRISQGDEVYMIQNSPLERGFGGLFVIPSSVEKKLFKLEIHRKYKLDTPHGARILEHNLEDPIRTLTPLLKFENALYEWEKSTKESWAHASDLVREVLDEVPSSSQFYKHIYASYLMMLVELEEDEKLDALISKQEELQNDSDQKLSLWAVALSSDHQGEFDSAAKNYRKLLNRLDGEGNLGIIWELNRAEALGRLGGLQILTGYHQGDDRSMESGKLLIETALDIAFKFSEIRLVAKLQNDLSTYYWLKKLYAKGESLLLESLKNHREAGPSKRLGDTLNNLSLTYMWLGEPRKSLIAIREALDLEKKYPNSSEKAYLLHNLANVYLRLGSFELAELSSTHAMKIFSVAKNEYGIAISKLLLGQSFREQKKYKQAIQVHSGALNYFLSEYKKNRSFSTRIIRARIELFNDHIDSGQLLQAREVAMELRDTDTLIENETLDVVSEFTVDQLNAQLVFLKLAVIEGNIAEYSKYDKMLSELFSDFDTSQAYIIERLEYQKLKLRYLLTAKKWDELKKAAEESISLIGVVRSQLNVRHLGPAWSSKSQEVLDLYTVALVELSEKSKSLADRDKLFKFLDENHAVSLRQSRAFESGVELLGNAEQKKALFGASRKELDAAIARTVVDRQGALMRVAEARESIRAKTDVNPRKILNGLGLVDLQKNLSDDEMAIRWVITDSLTMMYSVTNKIVQSIRLKTREDLVSIRKQLINEISNESLDVVNTAKKAASFLGLLEIDLTGINKLILLTGSSLSSFPIGAANVATEENLYRPLQENIEIVRVFSFADYFDTTFENKRSLFNNDIAIFADPIFNVQKLVALDNSEVRAPVFRGWTRKLTRLPWTAQEAQSIKDVFAQKRIYLRLRGSATTEALMSKEMRHSKVLHIASHGYFNNLTPGVVGIATSEEASDGKPGFLTLTQLLSKSFPSNLIVISGCETSLGSEINGEGLNGLTRGVLAQGAGSVIGTLWPIPDRPTAKFMKNFYVNLKRHDGDASMALSETKDFFLKRGRFKHPFYWAGFILTSANKQYDSNVFR